MTAIDSFGFSEHQISHEGDPTPHLTPEEEADYDRTDAQGFMNAQQIREAASKGRLNVGQAKEPEFYMEGGYEVAVPQRQKPGSTSELRRGGPKGPRIPRSRRGLSGRQRLFADEPPKGYDGR